MNKNIKRLCWFVGAIVLAGVLYAILFYPYVTLLHQELPFMGLLKRALGVLLLCCVLCLYRVLRGPTAPDRAVAIDILGILIVGFCAILSISTGRSWYIDIAIAWSLQSFIGTLALAKYLEGKGFDE